ncbi:adenylyltransferase/sulfurtransferase MoeZ [Corynebacterium amycolatum]|uniref:ThiF family adenylyltransferase n=1 Tax=Corynebacterium TaxID=1716 RepID=UPI00066920B7|nr:MULTISPECIES: ThiF family adenylyltransferase [Corynebacterium]KAA9223792.1 adenylyltransferase/sulfurtransferase MoeZ [Corynebacterium amycolatum]MBC6748679.1 adenylyltransferase/sulfurtransferase MoeZ [Corynebacterium sp. LK25]OFL73083.1 adenylyltransferase/sulfurtransferase MoeZ [Corynebacterium sp. HMSC063G05]OFO24603.1 adenylyltransferase/sulfurtransferase MoeZ [Corynebacterium sp. HMSC064E07]TXS58443.1 adenylyltransferase/sulfurtransferase MoeZ [Corynebacterium sp. LK19]
MAEQGVNLSDRDLRRYARHLTLPGFGAEGQRTLRASRVLVIGAGGLGSPALLYLAGAGVGHITIIDDDVVDESNLQRQVIHRESDIGRPKAESAADAVRRLDSEASVTAIVGRLSVDNAEELFATHDVVLDGADNFATRYLSSDAAELTGTPLVWATILQFAGQLSVFWPGCGPMLRDLYPDIPDPGSVPSCAAGGVLGAMVGQIGSMMVVEAIKVLTGVGKAAVGKLVLIDALEATTRTLSFATDPEREPVSDLTEIAQVCAASWSENEDGAEQNVRSVGPHAVRELLAEGVPLIDVREPEEYAEAAIAGSVLVPLGEIRSRRWAAIREAWAERNLQPNSPRVVIHCHSGARSQQAIELLAGEVETDGATPELINLDGGIVAWQAAGQETVVKRGGTH